LREKEWKSFSRKPQSLAATVRAYHKPLTMHDLLAACSRTLSELWQAHLGESVLWRTRRVREAEIDPLVEVAAILSVVVLLAAIL
jgi:hypothetical protein